jgi:two-component system sensor histidine kinase YesM
MKGNNMGRSALSKFNSWNLDKKIFVSVTSMICCISIIMLGIFTAFYISSFIRQSNNIMQSQLSALAVNYESALNNYKGLVEALVIDNSIQVYLTDRNQDKAVNFTNVNNVRSTLQNAVNIYPNTQFIAIMDNEHNNFIYKSNISKISTNFSSTYMNDYEHSSNCFEDGPMRMSFNDAYLNNGYNMLNIYTPIYSTSAVNKKLGLLCIILNGTIFNEMSVNSSPNSNTEVFIIGDRDIIVSCKDNKLIGDKFEYSGMIKGNEGYFTKNQNLYAYQKIGRWNYYIVSIVPMMNAYRDNSIVIVFLIFISTVITIIGLALCKKIVSKTYRPLDNIVKAMNYAAEGKLDARINMEKVGIDFVKLANGFNYMMEEINALMNQVKLEQQQMDQIKFNALQSQIQPHFLYNTLDCIHWQASAYGNSELSAFVKALAQYYRLCLSNGKDIISLEQEIEHVKNYLIIQNMRYDNIIKSTIEIDNDCKKVMIPKISLQPLVENSIYHGIKIKEGRKGEIKITAHKADNCVLVIVADTGMGMSDEELDKVNNSISDYTKDFGYGIRNVNRRIELLFGKGFGLHYVKNESGGVTVEIRLPDHEVKIHKEVI